MGRGATEAYWVNWRLLRWQRQPLDTPHVAADSCLRATPRAGGPQLRPFRLGQSLAAVLCCSIVLQRHIGLHSHNCASLLAM